MNRTVASSTVRTPKSSIIWKARWRTDERGLFRRSNSSRLITTTTSKPPTPYTHDTPLPLERRQIEAVPAIKPAVPKKVSPNPHDRRELRTGRRKKNCKIPKSKIGLPISKRQKTKMASSNWPAMAPPASRCKTHVWFTYSERLIYEKSYIWLSYILYVVSY